MGVCLWANNAVKSKGCREKWLPSVYVCNWLVCGEWIGKSFFKVNTRDIRKFRPCSVTRLNFQSVEENRCKICKAGYSAVGGKQTERSHFSKLVAVTTTRIVTSD